MAAQSWRNCVRLTTWWNGPVENGRPFTMIVGRTSREVFVTRFKYSQLLLLAILWTASICIAQSQQPASAPRLGFSGCSPAVFFSLRSGLTLKLSEITYEGLTIAGKTYINSGMLKSFREEVLEGSGPPSTLIVTVDLGKWAGTCSSLAYAVLLAGRTLQSPPFETFDVSRLAGMIAFSPEEGAGILVGGGALETDLITELGYDKNGRKYIRRQVFGLLNVKYEAVYSDYAYSGPPTGKLSGFVARINAVHP